MNNLQQTNQEFSFKDCFVPLTTLKAIHFIIFIGLIVFFNTLFNGFVGDDSGQLVRNSFVHSVSNIPAFFLSSTFDSGNGIAGVYYKPLLLTTFSFIYSIWGPNPFPFHLIQVLLHIGNTLLLFFFLKRFISKEWAFFLSVVFLVHPINQDTAAYISNYQDVLFFFFGMLALLVTTSKNTKYANLKIFSFLALSVLSKETGIVFLFINLIYVFLFKKELLKKMFIYSMLFFITYNLLHYYVVDMHFTGVHAYSISRLPLLERLINIPQIIIYYLYTFIFPKSLSINHDWIVKHITFSSFYLPLISILLFLTAVTFVSKKLLKKSSESFHAFIFFSLWFLLGLGLHIQILPLDGTVATRWFYLPIAGLLGMIGVTLHSFIKDKKFRKSFFIIFILIIMILSIRTIIRNNNFKDNLTLMCHDADESHENFSLETSCGVSLFTAGNYDEAQKHFEIANKLAPHNGKSWWGLGTILGRKAISQNDEKLFREAEAALKKAIKNEPNVPRAYENLGYIYTYFKDPKETKTFLTNALETFPNNPKLWLYLAVTENKLGNKKAALAAIKNAYSLNPNDKEVIEEYNKFVKK